MNDSLRRGLEQLADRGDPRGAADVIDAARVAVHRRRTRTRRLVAVGAVALVVACAGAIVAIVDDDPAREIVTQPTVDPADAPPQDQGPITLWLSETVVPVGGADVVAVLRNTGTGSPVFGVPTFLDRWDGDEWHEVLLFATCLDHWHCIAELEPAEAFEDIGLVAPPGGAGAAEYVRIEGLDAGWYRFRKVANEGDVATGTFEVVDRDVATVPLVDVTSARLLVPPLVAADGGMTSVQVSLPSRDGVLTAGDIEAYVVGLLDRAGIDRWTGSSWDGVWAGKLTDLPLSGPGAFEVDMPVLGPGAYRLVRSAPDGTDIYGYFWVVDERSSATVARELRLDGGSVVAIDLPASYELTEGPVVAPNPGGDGATTRWTFASSVAHAVLSVSVNKGPQADAWFATMTGVEGVTRQGAQVFVDETAGLPQRSIGWSPQARTVVWLGTNSLPLDDLLAVSESVRYSS